MAPTYDAAERIRGRHPWAHNKRIVVTGATYGIGKALCDALLSDGAKVVNISRTPNPSEAVTNIKADLLQLDDVQFAIAEIIKMGRPIDGIVNNVAVRELARLEDADAVHWHRQLDANVVHPILLLRGVVPQLSPGASIVNVSSSASRQAHPGTMGYSAAQAALETASKVLALEFAARGIRVNVLAPGPTDTPGLRRSVERANSLDLMSLAARIPMGRVGTVDDQVAALLFLLSPSAQFVTGQILGVNGGLVV